MKNEGRLVVEETKENTRGVGRKGKGKKEGEKGKEKRLVEMNGMTVELDCNHRKTL